MQGGDEGVKAVVAGDGPATDVAGALREAGIGAVETAADADAVLDRAGDVDCVVAAPTVGSTGWRELLEDLRALDPDLPVVQLCPPDAAVDPATAVEAGATDCVRWSGGDGEPAVLANRVRLAAERRRAEASAKESWRRYSRLLEASPAAIVIFDADGELLYANEAAASLAGADDPTEVAGERLYDFVAPEAVDRVREQVRRVIEDREPVDRNELAAQGIDGERRYVEATASPVTVDGEPAGQAAFVDVTDLKEREQRIREERDRFTALFESVPEPTVHVEFADGARVVRNANPAFEETFGYGAEEARGRSIADLIVPEERRAEAERVGEAALEGEVERELKRETVDGEREFLFRARPVDTEGDRRESLCIYVDITEQKRRQADLRRQNERLDAFASVVSHDLQSPLAVAKGNLYLIREEGDGEYVDKVDDALDRMERIIEDLLRLARGDEQATDPEPTDAGSVVAEAWTSVDIPGGELVNRWDRRVIADRGQLRELLENLLRNAVEHGGEDVTVEVGSIGDRGFYVADDGPGIPADEREAIFEPGYTTHEGGTGFGLVAVQEIAQGHGWRVKAAESEAGGARIEVTGVSYDDAPGGHEDAGGEAAGSADGD